MQLYTFGNVYKKYSYTTYTRCLNISSYLHTKYAERHIPKYAPFIYNVSYLIFMYVVILVIW